MIRALLDTNVLVSALLTSKGAPAGLLRAWLNGTFELVTSGRMLEELRGVLERPKFRSYVADADIREFVDVLRTRAIVTPDLDERAGVSEDPEDDHVIALASREAAVLVSGDDQMLGFRVPGLAILNPRAFLEVLSD